MQSTPGMRAYSTPDGRWYSAAVFTRTVNGPVKASAVNAAIGQAAAQAIELLAREETLRGRQ